MVASLARPESAVLRLTLYDVERNQAKEVPLRFVELHGRPHVLYPIEPRPDWVTQATQADVVRWSVGRREFIGTASEVTDRSELRNEVLPTFVGAYGRERLSQWFGAGVGCVSFVESRDRIPYYHAVESLFDRSASRYDEAVESNPFDRHLRTVALDVLREEFRPGDRVLELGCGTGLETIPLAESGIHVVALDLSRGMLGELDRKAHAASVHARIETRQARISDLSGLVRELGPESFDGAFSHFGALNCEPDLTALPEALRQLVKPDGRVSLGIWNRTCVSEMVLYGIQLRPGRAFARFHSSVPVGRSRFGVPVFPHSPGEVTRLFSSQFSLEKSVGVSVLMPPYNLGSRLVPHPRFVTWLESADRRMKTLPFFRYLGDHFLLELRRR
jgi:SAM-dependent methyltransferase